jgi:hypothetical protein
MANKVTINEFNTIKNESYTLVTFEDGKRVMTTSGLSFYRVVEELIKNRGPYVTLVINEKDLEKGRLDTCSWDLEDYEIYFKMQKRLF